VERKNDMNNRKIKNNLPPNLLMQNETNKNIIVQNEVIIDESVIFERVSKIIESRKSRAAAYANSEVTLMYWEVGQYINSVILDFKRAEYGKRFSPRCRENWLKHTETVLKKKIYIA